jgi:hypothetical protein
MQRQSKCSGDTGRPRHGRLVAQAQTVKVCKLRNLEEGRSWAAVLDGPQDHILSPVVNICFPWVLEMFVMSAMMEPG